MNLKFTTLPYWLTIHCKDIFIHLTPPLYEFQYILNYLKILKKGCKWLFFEISIICNNFGIRNLILNVFILLIYIYINIFPHLH